MICSASRTSDEIQIRIKRIPEKSRHAKRVAPRSASRLKGAGMEGSRRLHKWQPFATAFSRQHYEALLCI